MCWGQSDFSGKASSAKGWCPSLSFFNSPFLQKLKGGSCTLMALEQVTQDLRTKGWQVSLYTGGGGGWVRHTHSFHTLSSSGFKCRGSVNSGCYFIKNKPLMPHSNQAMTNCDLWDTLFTLVLPYLLYRDFDIRTVAAYLGVVVSTNTCLSQPHRYHLLDVGPVRGTNRRSNTGKRQLP